MDIVSFNVNFKHNISYIVLKLNKIFEKETKKNSNKFEIKICIINENNTLVYVYRIKHISIIG